jgi:hypothetical protein
MPYGRLRAWFGHASPGRVAAGPPSTRTRPELRPICDHELRESPHDATYPRLDSPGGRPGPTDVPPAFRAFLPLLAASHLTRPRGFEPLTFGSVDPRSTGCVPLARASRVTLCNRRCHESSRLVAKAALLTDAASDPAVAIRALRKPLAQPPVRGALPLFAGTAGPTIGSPTSSGSRPRSSWRASGRRSPRPRESRKPVDPRAQWLQQQPRLSP